MIAKLKEPAFINKVELKSKASEEIQLSFLDMDGQNLKTQPFDFKKSL